MKIPIPTQILQYPIRSTLFSVALFFVIAGLIGIAHEDLRYKRTFLSGTRVSEPEPGDVYLFDTASMRFDPDKICPRTSAHGVISTRDTVFVVSPSWASGVDGAVVLIRAVFPWLLGNGAEVSNTASVSAIGPGFKEKLGSSFQYKEAYNKGPKRFKLSEACAKELDRERNETPSLIPVRVLEVYYPADKDVSNPNPNPNTKPNPKPVMLAMSILRDSCSDNVSSENCSKAKAKAQTVVEQQMLADIGFLPRVRAGFLSVHP